jgi:hypothetical protein
MTYGGLFDDDDRGRRFDVLKTMKRQSNWNRYAAWLAAATSTVQMFALIEPLIQSH